MTHNQKTAITSPVKGLTVWCTNCGSTGEMQVYNGSVWTNMLGETALIPVLFNELTSTPSAAYSLRKVNSTYVGNAIRARRSSDNVQSDIGFDSKGNLNETALVDFVGTGNNGFVTIWYDQSGNERHVLQTTDANQPLIVSIGEIIKRGSKPVVYMPASPSVTYLQANASIGLPATFVNVVGVDNLTSSDIALTHFGTSNGIGTRIATGGQILASKRGIANVNTSLYVTAMSLNVFSLTQAASGVSSQTEIFLNGSGRTIDNQQVLFPLSKYTIGAFATSDTTVQSFQNEGFISESIVFSQIISTTYRQALVRNQGAYYNITVN